MSSRSSSQPNHSDRLPLDPESGQAIPPSAQPGYYPGFSTLSQQAFWDAATRRTVLNRVANDPPIRFFTPEEAHLLSAVLARLLPQDDRTADSHIPLLGSIDDRLWNDRIDGYRFEDMPSDRDAYRIGLPGIDAIAQHLFGQAFPELEPDQQDEVLWTMHDANPPAGDEIWQRVPVDRFWLLLLQDAIESYYAHPFSWDEIGFGGPSYPRGYFRLENGKPEPWEVEEERYQWAAPPSSSSGQYRALGGRTHHAGQEGTH